MCLSSRASWARGECEMEWISDSGFGEVFVALDKASNDLVDFVKKCLVKDVKKRASVEALLKVVLSLQCDD